jgi:hypothetical protein
MQINRCPKCGKEPSESILSNGQYKLMGVEIECYDCGLHTGSCKNKSEAVKKWNEMTKGENK